MKIIRNFNKKNEKFGIIDCGTVFMFNNICYIKLSGEAKIKNDIFVNAVSLEDGAMKSFKDYQEVQIIKATLTIED